MAERLDRRDAATAVAPDGSNVEILLGLDALSTARFTFPARSISAAVRHRTVSEIWFFLTGIGHFWTSSGPDEGIEVSPGVSISVAPGESFQVRSTSDDELSAFGVTSPGWPGDGEAEIVKGPWEPTLTPGPYERQ